MNTVLDVCPGCAFVAPHHHANCPRHPARPQEKKHGGDSRQCVERCIAAGNDPIACEKACRALDAVLAARGQPTCAGVCHGGSCACKRQLPQVKTDARRFHHTKTNSLPTHGDGHWITIGGHAEGDKKHAGGSPVYIEGGRIIKGAPGLVGRSVSNLKAPAEHGSHREQLKRSREYDSAKWHKKAKREGIDPKHLHALAEDIEAHDKAHVEERKRVIQRARQKLQHFGYGPQSLTTNLRRSGEFDIPHIDQVAEELYTEFPGQFAGHERDLYDRVVDMLTEGNPKPMSKDEIYETALNHLREHGVGGSEVSDKPLFEEDENGIPPSPHHQDKIDDAWERFNSGHQAGGRGGLFGSGDTAGRAAFSKLPENTPVLIAEGQYAGHTARIVRDKENHRVAAEIDGAPHLGLIPVNHTSVEPLSSARSWRTDTASAPSTQGSLLTAEHFLPRKSYLWCDPPDGHPWAWRRPRRIGRTKTAPAEELADKDAELILQALEEMRG
jgi:hypothetical protein